MTSTLQVQTLQGPTSGADSNTVRVADGHNLHAKGHVVQYVETSDGDAYAGLAITSDTFVDTGITISITPKFIGSKVCVEYVGSVSQTSSGASLTLTLFRNGVQATGQYGIGHILGGSQNTQPVYSPLSGQYTFTTTSLWPLEFTIYAKSNSSGKYVFPIINNSSYRFSATEYAQ